MERKTFTCNCAKQDDVKYHVYMQHRKQNDKPKLQDRNTLGAHTGRTQYKFDSARTALSSTALDVLHGYRMSQVIVLEPLLDAELWFCLQLLGRLTSFHTPHHSIPAKYNPSLLRSLKVLKLCSKANEKELLLQISLSLQR